MKKGDLIKSPFFLPKNQSGNENQIPQYKKYHHSQKNPIIFHICITIKVQVCSIKKASADAFNQNF